MLSSFLSDSFSLSSLFSIVALSLALSYALFILSQIPPLRSFFSNPNEAPAVFTFIPHLGHAISFGKNPFDFLTRCRSSYGKVFTATLAGKRMTFLTHPADYSALFKNKALSFQLVADEISLNVLDQRPKSIGNAAVDEEVHRGYTKHLSGEGLETLTKRSQNCIFRWMQQKKISLLQVVSGSNSRLSFTSGLNELVNAIIFDAGVRSMYGAVPLNNLQQLFNSFDAAFPLLVAQAPPMFLKNGLKARAELISRFASFQHREGESPLIAQRIDLFNRFKGDVFSEHDVGALHMAILWASVANTIPATFWTIFYLLKDPEALKAVKQEIQDHLPVSPLFVKDSGKDKDRAVDVEDSVYQSWNQPELTKCVLMESCILEALRLATGSMVMRRAAEDTQLTTADGKTYYIRKNDGVTIFPSLAHYDESIFPNPWSFNYRRFADANAPPAFLPFGAGSTLCPGRFWAKNEIKIFLALLFQHFDIELVDSQQKTPEFDQSRVGLGVYNPATDVQIRLTFKQ